MTITIRPIFMRGMGGNKVSIEIQTLKVLEGKISPRALGLVVEWASLHKDELMKDWGLAKSNKPPEKIEPLI